MSTETPRPAWPKKLFVLLGGALAVACQFLPPDHRALCTAVVKLASLTCGGVGG